MSLLERRSSAQVFNLGIDVGSTTIKAVIMDEKRNILFRTYQRHFSDIRASIMNVIDEIYKNYKGHSVRMAMTGSGALALSELLKVPFIQEVIAETKAIRTYIPQTDVAIELGGEDGKITFFDKYSIDQRMNEICAGGTGAFIDQMAVVLKTDAEGVNNYAKDFKNIYPIAARCGVFAKTDILPLLNEGASKPDVAASIFQAVVNQTIGGLACGHKIKGNVAFLGGPLFFMDQLRRRFIETLKLTPEQVIFPQDAQYFVAIGAALSAQDKEPLLVDELRSRAEVDCQKVDKLRDSTLPPLFRSQAEYDQFVQDHDHAAVNTKPLEDAKGDLFLGLDAGSTTTKAVLLDQDNNLLYSWYGMNKGDPLNSAIEIIQDIYKKIPKNAHIKSSAITGYGEDLIKAALNIDVGEVETIAHYRAAAFFEKDVSFVLDIGGQDMKCIYIRNGAVDKIVLNEACSSGCGSFLSNFAESLSLTMPEFVEKALLAKQPVDLGSRCTVFMNSKIKQAQKEGASVGDISAGLAYSVIKNALYKVMCLSSIEALGKKVVVQGGTFYNNAVLKALEVILGISVIRPNIAGIMGAFGAALIAKERAHEGLSTLLSTKELSDFHVQNRLVHCGRCTNNCLLTISTFPNGRKFISGNRCERGAGNFGVETKTAFNMYSYTYERLFNYYTPLENPTRGEIGVPRVLNMYEDYPFWFTLLTNLGFKVVLSDPSSKKLFDSGLESITSQTLCFPAKIVNGHIVNLIQKGLKTIFYPCLPFEKKDFSDADHHFNCPVVASYPEVIRMNLEDIKENKVKLLSPFLPIDHPKKLVKRILQEFKEYNLTPKEVRHAVQEAVKERQAFCDDLTNKAKEIIDQVNQSGGKGIILGGQPYHVDPFVNHGIPDKIVAEGIPVLSTASVAPLGKKLHYRLNVVDQWVYHSRQYRAATVAINNPNFEFVQMNSFGCGINAITTGEVNNLLESANRLYTMLKIDEGANLGAVRIRIRSLLAAMRDRSNVTKVVPPKKVKDFSQDMKSTYTILCPQFSPLHFQLLHDVMLPLGYNLEVLPEFNQKMIEEGLRYVNNDACYPSIVVIGQLMAALKSGKYDLNRTALIISQTSGGCRATNYISLLKGALLKAGMPDIPVLALNMKNANEKGLKLTLRVARHIVMSIAYGDLLLRLSNKTRPYEKEPGAVNELLDKWFIKLKMGLNSSTHKDYIRNIKQIVHDFDTVELKDIPPKPKVGIVGEILVQFHPGANNHLVEFIEQEGGEAVVPDLLDFVNYVFFDDVSIHKFLSGSWVKSIQSKIAAGLLEKYFRNPMRQALKASRRFQSFPTTKELYEKSKELVHVCNLMGEGWLLTAEMMEFIESGAPNIVCVQPFGCLPNYITGKGAFKAVKNKYPKANIISVDYDAGASKTNQVNRIKLMMSNILHTDTPEEK